MNDIEARHEVPGLTAEEAYGAVAGEMYIPGEDGYVAPSEVLDDLEPEIVKAAKAYAELEHLAWPPIASGYIMTVGFLPPRDWDPTIDGVCEPMTFDPTPARIEVVGNTTVYHLNEPKHEVSERGYPHINGQDMDCPACLAGERYEETK
jgi:hypothetical protein